MKLYLSSFRLGNHPERLIELLSSNTKTAVIVNAIDETTEQVRKLGVERELNDLLSLGLNAEECDLRDYFGKKAELKNHLNHYGLVWIRGGNTFVLRRAMNESGLDEVLKEKKTDKDFVYAGYSAAICVLAPTLKGLEFVDDPSIVPFGYQPEIIWDGLDLLPYSIAPHYRSDHPESPAVEKLVQYFTQHNIPFKSLHDGEVIIEMF
jgi:dipeptidase E